MTPWLFSEWLRAWSEEKEEVTKLVNLFLVANAWHTGKYMRLKTFPSSLSEELRIAGGGSRRLSPEASVDQMKGFLSAVNASSKKG